MASGDRRGSRAMLLRWDRLYREAKWNGCVFSFEFCLIPNTQVFSRIVSFPLFHCFNINRLFINYLQGQVDSIFSIPYCVTLLLLLYYITIIFDTISILVILNIILIPYIFVCFLLILLIFLLILSQVPLSTAWGLHLNVLHSGFWWFSFQVSF